MLNFIKDEKSYDDIVVLGDIHGNFHVIIEWLNRTKLHNVCIIQVGDFGLFNDGAMNKERLFKLNEHLVEHQATLYSIRGNHDYPKFWAVDHFNLSNIKFIPDFTILTLIKWHTNENKFFCMGGAISIDRRIRYKGLDYFEDEVIPYDGSQDLSEVVDVQYVITHTAPQLFPPFAFNDLVNDFIRIDPDLRLDLLHERAMLNLMYEHIKRQNNIKVWYYGHFHNHTTYDIDGMIARMVNINQFVEVK